MSSRTSGQPQQKPDSRMFWDDIVGSVEADDERQIAVADDWQLQCDDDDDKRDNKYA